MSATLLPHVESGTTPISPVGPGPYIIATDGSERADGALRAAELLIARYGATAKIVSVVEPLPIVAPEVQLPVTPELEQARRADRMTALRDQLLRVTGDERGWPLTLRSGVTPEQIAEQARDTKAKLIIVGLGRHGVIDRLFGDETALHLLRTSSVPVLAVPANADRFPRRVIVAMDFSASAMLAARAALELIEDGGTLTLVHVVSRDLEQAVWVELETEYVKMVQSNFEQVTRQLAAPPSISVETITLRGDPAREILQFASRNVADLIAVGSHGHGFFSRLLLGSVATKILRCATCMVLGVPLAALEGGALATSGDNVSQVPEGQWEVDAPKA